MTDKCIVNRYQAGNRINYGKTFVSNMKDIHVGDDKVLLCASLFVNAMSVLHGVPCHHVQHTDTQNAIQVSIYVDAESAEERGIAGLFEVAQELGLCIHTDSNSHMGNTYCIELHTLASAYRLMALALDLTNLTNNDSLNTPH